MPCYICGRSYGSWVIQMHEQQCLRKWRRENDKLSDEEQQEEPQRQTELSPGEKSLCAYENNRPFFLRQKSMHT